MPEELKSMIERARHYRMSSEEITAQEISFAYSNAHCENDRITRELVAEALPASDLTHVVEEARA